MIIDSNVLIDIFEIDGQYADSSFSAVSVQVARGAAHVDLIVFAEISSRFVSVQRADNDLRRLGLVMLDLNQAVAYRAGHALAAYRRNGGDRTSILPDFLIGAHAEVLGIPIMTRDKRRFASYFPSVELIDPRTLHA